jgi:hypothetical protein
MVVLVATEEIPHLAPLLPMVEGAVLVTTQLLPQALLEVLAVGVVFPHLQVQAVLVIPQLLHQAKETLEVIIITLHRMAAEVVAEQV